MRKILCALCVLAGAVPSVANTPDASIGGRWQGDNYRMAALSPGCDGGKCKLTLDIVPCGADWCGIEVSATDTCGATALKLDSGKAETSGGTTFEGRLELASGTEPYVIRAYAEPAKEGNMRLLHMTGDTGGEFRIFRRSFPFHAMLSRVGDAVCKDTPKPVS